MRFSYLCFFCFLLLLSSCQQESIKENSGDEKHPMSAKFSELDKRLNYLKRVVSDTNSDSSVFDEIALTNPEWVLFTYSFTTSSCYHLIKKDSLSRVKGEKLMRLCISKLISNQLLDIFRGDDSFSNTDHFYSVLNLGHLNLMLTMYNEISEDTSYEDLNHKVSNYLITAYNSSDIMNLESYHNSIWLSDNTSAMASLQLYLDNNNMESTIVTKWLDKMKQDYIHEETNLFYSTIDNKTGRVIEEPRGSMLGWIIFFMNYIDSDYADELFTHYKKHFSSEKFGFRLFRERYDNYDSKEGDIDSGPIFMGVSVPANQFALIDAINADDKEVVRQLEVLVNSGTKLVETDREIYYETPLIDFEISPLSEALMLYAISLK